MVTTNEPNIYETGVLDSNAEGNFVYTTLDAAINWIRKNSLWPMPMGLSCCAIEFMAVACSRYDLSRFGSEVTRFSPRQADVMIVAGTVTYKMALAVRRHLGPDAGTQMVHRHGRVRFHRRHVPLLFRTPRRGQDSSRGRLHFRLPAPSGGYSGSPAHPAQEAGYPAARTHFLQEGRTSRSQRSRPGQHGNAP